MMIPEKLTSIERALIAAAAMSPNDARNVLRLICEGGMTTTVKVEQQTPGAIHYAKREKFINRMQDACDRVLDYAKHETLRNVEKHFRDTGLAGADEPVPETSPTTARITFKKDRFTEDLTAALQDEIVPTLATAGQQLFDEVGKDDPW